MRRVEYREAEAKSILNAVQGMGFRWSANAYRGCTHGCHYCYARRYHTQFELDSDDQFASIIFVKTNFVEVLRSELDRPSWTREYVAFGTATDCYQPIEGHYKLTRRSLEALMECDNPVGVITKGPMIVRDKDILADLTKGPGCGVYISVPTVDEDAWRLLKLLYSLIVMSFAVEIWKQPYIPDTGTAQFELKLEPVP